MLTRGERNRLRHERPAAAWNVVRLASRIPGSAAGIGSACRHLLQNGGACCIMQEDKAIDSLMFLISFLYPTQVFLPRLYQSVYRSFAVQIIILVLWVGFHHFSLLSPWQGLCQTGNVFLLPGSWLYLVLVFICLACQGVLLGRHVAVEPFVAKNRAAYLLRMSEADALLSLSSSMLIGGVLVRCYLGLQDDVSLNHLTVSCAEDSDS